MTPNDRLRQLRKRARKTQKEVAHYLNIGLSTYRGWEKNHFPKTFEQVVKLCAYIGMSETYYLTGKNNETLTDQELEVLLWYRALPEEAQEGFLTLIRLKKR